MVYNSIQDHVFEFYMQRNFKLERILGSREFTTRLKVGLVRSIYIVHLDKNITCI